MRAERWRSWAVIAFSFGVAILGVILIARNDVLVETTIISLGVFGPLAILAMYMLLGLSPIPSDPLTLINGAVYGPLGGAALALIGTTLASLVEYYLGTRIADAAHFEQRKGELPWGLDRLPVDSIWFLIGGRMITGAGSKLVSFISGVYRIRLVRYLWTTALANLFGSVVFALSGFGLLRIF
jgi:phospholipase D1/2